MSRGSLHIMVWMAVVYSSVSNAFIYHAIVLKKWNAAINDYQYIIALSDFHADIHAVNCAQRAQLESIISCYEPQKTQVIVEDLASKNEKGCDRCGPFFIKQGTSILSGLSRACTEKRMSTCNVEYRYCRVVSLAPLMSFDCGRSCAEQVRMSQIIDEIKQMIKDIRGYDDGVLLNRYYKQCSSCVERELARLPKRAGPDQSVADYIALHAPDEKKMDVLRHLCVFDSACIDAKIVHAIAQAPDKQLLIVVAGGTHVINVGQQLIASGYTKVKEISGVVEHEYDLNKCIGLDIVDGCFCVRPQAIDLMFLKECDQEWGV